MTTSRSTGAHQLRPHHHVSFGPAAAAGEGPALRASSPASAAAASPHGFCSILVTRNTSGTQVQATKVALSAKSLADAEQPWCLQSSKHHAVQSIAACADYSNSNSSPVLGRAHASSCAAGDGVQQQHRPVIIPNSSSSPPQPIRAMPQTCCSTEQGRLPLLHGGSFLQQQQQQHRLARSHSASAKRNDVHVQGMAPAFGRHGPLTHSPSSPALTCHSPLAWECAADSFSDMDSIRAVSSRQASLARLKLLQEVEQQRELQRAQLLQRNMLRWKLNHAAYTANKHLKQLLQRARSSSMQQGADDGGWAGENGQADAVSTAVEQRLHSLQARLVPTAIEQQQQVRKLLKDRDQGFVRALQSLWQDVKLARRLRERANSTSSSRAVPLTSSSGGPPPAGDSKPRFWDPLVHGVREPAVEAVWQSGKLPPWIAYRPDFLNPGAGGEQFWSQLWQRPPFSTALADAEEHRRQRGGAGWCGGPKTEQGLLAFEELQLQHMLAEQRWAFTRMQLRRLLSALPGLGHLKTVPLMQVLGSCGSASVSADAVLDTAAAACALQHNIRGLRLLLKQHKAATAGNGHPLQSSAPGTSGSTSSSSKRRMLHAEHVLACRQNQLLLLRDTLPTVIGIKQEAAARQCQLELQHHMDLVQSGRAALEVSGGTRRILLNTGAGGASLLTAAAAVQDDGCLAVLEFDSVEQLKELELQVVQDWEQSGRAALEVSGGTRCTSLYSGAGGASLLTAAAAVQDDGCPGLESIRYSAKHLKEHDLFQLAAWVWGYQHEVDLQRLRELDSLAPDIPDMGTTGALGRVAKWLAQRQDGFQGNITRTAQQQQQQQQKKEPWPGDDTQQQQQMPGSMRQHSQDSSGKQGDFLRKYAHRIKPGGRESRKLARLEQAERQRELRALSELYMGTPAWQDAAAIGPMGPEVARMVVECIRAAAPPPSEVD